MSLVVNHNLMAANVARNLNTHYGNLSKSTQRLSTGLRINSAADDAAGLAIRELQRADIIALHQGARNANDAISMIQVADGALGVIDEKLIRMKELAEQAATGTYDSTQRMMIESEYQAMASEITRIANATDFNGIHLLDGTLSGEHNGSGLTSTGKMKIHFGTGNDSAEDYYYIQIGCATAAALGLGNDAKLDASQTLTHEYYISLRDKSAQEAYDVTYKKKYNEIYDSIYKKLTTGTSEAAAISAADASDAANKIADKLAAEYAERDRDMAAAAMDKIFNDSYGNHYQDLFAQNLEQGMSSSNAHNAADLAAVAAALEDVLTVNKSVVETNSVSPYLEKDALPPMNSVGAAALVEQGSSLAYQNAYGKIYDELFSSAVDNALVETEIMGVDETTYVLAPKKTVLTSAQILDIHNGVHKAADEQAQKVASEVKANLHELYASAYGLNGTDGVIYQEYYNEAIAEGNTEEVASKIAEKKATDYVWPKLVEALTNPPKNWLTTISADDLSVSTDIPISTSYPSSDKLDDLIDTITIESPSATTAADFKALLEETIASAIKSGGSVNPMSTVVSEITSTMTTRLYERFKNDLDTTLASNTTFTSLTSADQASTLSTAYSKLYTEAADRAGKIAEKIQDGFNEAGIYPSLKEGFYNGAGLSSTYALSPSDFDASSNIASLDLTSTPLNTTLSVSWTPGTATDVSLAYQIAGTVGLKTLYDNTNSTPLRDTLFNYVQDKRYNEILNMVSYPPSGATPAQVKDMQRVADETAKAITYTVITEIAEELRTIYDTNFDSIGTDGKGWGLYYTQYLAEGMSESSAKTAAMNSAAEDAWNAVQAALSEYIHGNEGLLNSKYFTYLERSFYLSGIGYVTAPAETADPTTAAGTEGKALTYQAAGAAALEKATPNTESVRDYVYTTVYDLRYKNAVKQLFPSGIPDTDPITGLTKLQIETSLHTAADATANAVANEVSNQIKAALHQVYDHAYEEVTTTGDITDSGYLHYYMKNINSGMSESDAKSAALESVAKKTAWDAVKLSLVRAKYDGTPMGVDTAHPIADKDATDYLKGHAIALSQFGYGTYQLQMGDEKNKVIPYVLNEYPTGTESYVLPESFITDVYKKLGTSGLAYLNDTTKDTLHTVDVLATYEGTNADVSTLYSAIGTDATTWLNVNHAMNGGDEAMIAAAEEFCKCWNENSATKLQDGGTVATQDAAQKAIVAINRAIVSKDKIRADLGALQNRFENTITNLNTMAENLQAAESRISDVDVATEMTEFVRQQILTQSAVAMLAQANSLPQMAMQLIGG